MMIQRRSFITLLGGAAATWPMATRGQEAAVLVVGSLVASNSSDVEENNER